MTDNEIIKALECCSTYKGKCTDCPAFVKVERSNCKQVLLGSMEIINRQKAEIELLKKLYDGADACIDELEYALDKVGHSNSRVDDALEDYRNLVKEMVGDEQ